MKTCNLFIAIALFYLMSGCKKGGSSPEGITIYPSNLSGKWNVVKDSLSAGTAILQQVTYKGASGDYFDFRNDGKCYVKEGTKYDTMAYTITSDTSLNLIGFYTFSTDFYTKLSSPYINVTITSGTFYGPGFYSYRQVKLTR